MKKGMLEEEIIDLSWLGSGRASPWIQISGREKWDECRKDDELSFIQQIFIVSTWYKHRNIRGAWQICSQG